MFDPRPVFNKIVKLVYSADDANTVYRWQFDRRILSEPLLADVACVQMFSVDPPGWMSPVDVSLVEDGFENTVLECTYAYAVATASPDPTWRTNGSTAALADLLSGTGTLAEGQSGYIGSLPEAGREDKPASGLVGEAIVGVDVIPE